MKDLKMTYDERSKDMKESVDMLSSFENFMSDITPKRHRARRVDSQHTKYTSKQRKERDFLKRKRKIAENSKKRNKKDHPSDKQSIRRKNAKHATGRRRS